MRKWNYKRFALFLVVALAMTSLMAGTALAAGSGDVAGAVESTWTTASTQIKTVVNNVVFPAIDLILAVFFFVKVGTAYFDYRKTGQFEWTAPAILFACLVFTLTAPPVHLGHRWHLTSRKPCNQLRHKAVPAAGSLCYAVGTASF